MFGKYLFFIIIVAIPLAFTSCCNEEDVEVARYNLTESELALIPYTLGQRVTFTHSNGYEFDAFVDDIATEWQQYYDFCEWYCCGQEYFSYQTKRVLLRSSYPNLRMRFKLSENFYGEYSPMNINFDINHRHIVTIPYDSLGNFLTEAPEIFIHDSVSLNGITYHCVAEKLFDFHMFVDDKEVNTPYSILYSKSIGLLQIKMSNNETFTIKE
jgi:hypothetical protein